MMVSNEGLFSINAFPETLFNFVSTVRRLLLAVQSHAPKFQ
jgi:hypothetical protein